MIRRSKKSARFQKALFNQTTLFIRVFVFVFVTAIIGGACITRPFGVPKPDVEPVTEHVFPQTMDKEVDILFVVDNSGSMELEQDNLEKNFPKLIEALRSHDLGPEQGSSQGCNKEDPINGMKGCNIPNIRIGVVSSDMGAGDSGLCPRIEDGDRGLLASKGCDNGVYTTSPWIDYQCEENGTCTTNVGGISGTPVEQVQQAFGCRAKLGTKGCGFEQQLESAKRALSGLNEGFLRKDALLAIVVITDEDDCSAKNLQLFTPNEDVLGPQDNFRCFEYGFKCNNQTINRHKDGPLENCEPTGDYLHGVQEYVDFFKGLKKDADGKNKEGRVLFATIAGDTNKVEVIRNPKTANQAPFLNYSCESALGDATPALRINTVVEAFDKDGLGQFSSICDGDFGPAMNILGKKIIGNLGAQCLRKPPLAGDRTIVCQKGDVLGPDDAGQPVICKQDSLFAIDALARDNHKNGETMQIPKCSEGLFNNVQNENCGSECPCWRVVKKAQCEPKISGSPYGLQVLRADEPPKGLITKLAWQSSIEHWGTTAFAKRKQYGDSPMESPVESNPVGP